MCTLLMLYFVYTCYHILHAPAIQPVSNVDKTHVIIKPLTVMICDDLLSSEESTIE